MKKVLPLCKRPLIMSYQSHAYYLGILFTSKYFRDYFCCNFINWYYHQDANNKLDFVMERRYSDELFFLYNKVGYNTSLDLFNGDCIIQLISNMIQYNYYICGEINEYYVPHRLNYQKQYFEHDFLIYGFDSDRKEVNLIGYTDRGIYEETTLSFKDLERGLYSFKSTNWINFIKIDKDYEFVFDLKQYKSLLNDYLQSKNTYHQFEDKPCTFGINAIMNFAQDLRENCVLDDLKYYRLLFEHKKSMYYKIKYLLDHQYIEDKNLLSDYHDILLQFQVIFLLAIKNSTRFSFKFSVQTLDKIIQNIMSGTNAEIEVLDKLYHYL